MHDWLVSICQALQKNPVTVWLATSDYAFQCVQLTHFTGLSLWLSTTLAVDFSLLGVGKKFQTASQLSDALFVLNWTGLGIAVLGGFTLFTTAAVGYIDNPAFRLKLGVLIPAALVWHIVVQQKTRVWGKTSETSPIAKTAGLVEIVLWVSVATAAVWIPNFG